MSLQQSLADAEVELPIFFTGNITRHQPLHFGLQVRLAGPAKDHAILGAESMMVYFKNWTKGSRKNVCVSMAKKYALSEEVPALCCARVGASSCSRLTHARTTTSPQVMIRRINRDGLPIPASMKKTFSCEMLGRSTKVTSHATRWFPRGLSGLLKRDGELHPDIQAYYSAVEHAGHAGDLPAWLEDRDWSPERAAAFVTATQYDRTKVCVL